MPELPDVTIYVERLAARLIGQPLERVRLASPFLLRTVEPPLAAVEVRGLPALERMRKRLLGRQARALTYADLARSFARRRVDCECIGRILQSRLQAALLTDWGHARLKIV